MRKDAIKMLKLWSTKSPSFVGLRISDSSLECSIIKKSENQQLKCIAITSVPLTSYEVVNGRIFNHVKIYSILSEFMRSHKQEESYLIISCDDSLAKNEEKNGSLSLESHILFHFSLFSIAHNLKCIALTTHKGAMSAAQLLGNPVDQREISLDELVENKNNISSSLLLEAVGLFAIGKQCYEESY
jgi:hypothetical protein